MSLRHRRDFEFMQTVYTIAERSSEPLHLMYGMLHTDGDVPELPHFGRARHLEDDSANPMSEVGAMRSALSISRALWERYGEDCGVTCSMVRPDTDNPRLEIEHEGTALVFHKGSVRSTLSLGFLRAAGFAVSISCARGFAPSQRAERILEDTRRRALEHPGTEPLDRLDLQPRGAYRDKSAVIIFLHGLFSTDIGLFDPLIRALHDQPGFDQNCAFVGWPHDTLAGIDANSTKLRSLVDQVIGLDGPPVLFVAHSRGGLLARSVAVKLYEKNSRWTEKLRGCVTFGTPHEGCPLAEAPGDLLVS